MLIRRHPEPDVLELRLHRPQQLNALNRALAHELLEALRAAHANRAVRCILLTAEGRAFCAGKDRDEPATPEFVQLLQDLARALMDRRLPVVAAVQGWAVGAGCELLLNCDLVVAERSAKFMLPEVSAGLFGTGGVLALLPRTVGLARAKGILMLGEAFTAEEAGRWGLVWAVADEGTAAAQALHLARKLAAADPLVLQQVKAGLHHEVIGDLEGVLQREAGAHARIAAPADSR